LSEHVLVVEPAREERALLRSCLETAGYRVSTADCGEPALRAFEQAPADVVLLDVVAPGFEAFATCKRLRQLPSGAQAAIVCLTPRPDSATQDQALEAGADDCLAKPLDRPELLLKVRSLLRFKHLAEHLARDSESLRRERDALLRAQKLRDETLALVVHDMKNPLAGVLSNAEYLVSSKGLSADQSECAHDILGAARRMHRQVMSLLDVNLREHGALLPALSTFDLAELAEQVLHGCAPALVDKMLRCVLEGETASLPVRADRDMIARLIENLIDNAMRSSPHASEITLVLGRKAELVELRVTDRGPRFSEAYRVQVFDTYVKPDEGVRRARKGRGLGLASCRAIAEAHGGSIELADAQPEGSTFRVLMPIGPKLRSSG
jgi:two-component system, sensor histidine kinase and response regulator